MVIAVLRSKTFNWSKKKEKAMSDQVFKTKWGYVAYSYENYRKLKRLNVSFQKARSRASEFKRWARKDPQNRVQKKWLRNELGQKIGHEIVGPLPEPVVCELFSKKHKWFDKYDDCKFYITDNAIELEYQKARYPMRSPEHVLPGRMTTAEIEKLLISAEQEMA